jgi:hypothetical protein
LFAGLDEWSHERFNGVKRFFDARRGENPSLEMGRSCLDRLDEEKCERFNGLKKKLAQASPLCPSYLKRHG